MEVGKAIWVIKGNLVLKVEDNKEFLKFRVQKPSVISRNVN